MGNLAKPIAFVTGVLSHLLYFHHGEHHMNGLLYIFTLLSGTSAGTLVAKTQYGYSLLEAIKLVVPVVGTWLAGVYSSLIIWRAFFNPLNKFPGAFMARMTSFWWTTHIGSESHAFLKNQALHKKYGKFVRISPNQVSVAHEDAPELFYGHKSKCRKSEWYDGDKPLTSMHTSRDRPLHDRRRRVWSPAFSDKALRNYQQRVQPYADQLLRRIEEMKGKPVNVAQLFNFFGYDVMGDLAFGKDFGMLQSGEQHYAVTLLNEGMQPFAIFPPVWFFRILAAIPGMAAGYHKFVKYCDDQLQERLKKKPKDIDLMSPVVAPFEEGKRKPNKLELSYLCADSRLVIVAGSDTTSATLVYVFNYLARDPALVEKARKELEPLVSADGSFDNKEAANANFINGCINEALRLNPPVPTALQRLTPPEGLMVGDTYIPGNTCVWCPSYVMGHSEEIYAQPEEFIPERWYSRPELVKKKEAFFPFSLGPMGCIGKPLALMELRIVMAKLLLAFDVSYAPGETGKDLIEKSRDHFTIETGPLHLVFTPRKN
ncbi:uncharacterized protein PV09_01577 [Verruconis gallopava]|uniref:Uncharacterized protein n=1 Tax=Verruconis gallopava TaxID=253628 RepID=A0A0D1XXW3_9PEZI|nr:uncharacterized protein PV09_01577 [Verruconis gallopava]KIW07631.1 hypothetical protein PV09_01577 [Verruconis gallopava]